MLQSGVRVIRVLRRDGTATGVLVTINNTTTTTIPLSSTGRVILSGGALQTPQLLMYSGIGPASTLTLLSRAGRLDPSLPASSWLNNSAVGAGLFDNPNTFIELSSPAVSPYTFNYASPIPADAAAYVANRTGPYTVASEVAVFWDTHNYTSTSGNSTSTRLVTFQGTVGTASYQDYTGAHTFTLNIYGTSGLSSSGHVVLDPTTFLPGPSSDVYYSAASDAWTIASYISSIFSVLPHPGTNLPSSLTPLNIPFNATVAQIHDYITTPSAYARGEVNHWSSSCRFGGCVDAQDMRVVGMRNLHVVDASVVPPLSVNPQMGVMIVAERAGEILKGLL